MLTSRSLHLCLVLACLAGSVFQLSAQDVADDPLQPAVIPADISVTRGIEFARVGESVEVVLRYDMIRLDEDGGNEGKLKSPLLLFIHGGGWKGGDRNSYYRRLFFDATESLIRQGLAVATIDYRLAKKDGATTMDSVGDCRLALEYFKNNSTKLGLDISRIVVMGGSAGGHLTLMTALAPDRNGGQLPKVKACVPYYPLCHFGGVELHPQIMQGASYGSPGRFVVMLGGPPEEHRDIAGYLSPITHLRREMPAVFVLHGDADPVLPVASVRAFAERARELGAPVTYLEVVGGNHGFRTADSPDVAGITRKVKFFLAEQFELNAE